MPYLSGESPAQTRRALKEHLSSCPECRSQLAQWRAGLKALDAWKPPRAQATANLLAPATLKWAFALVLLFAGFVAGRFAPAAVNEQRIRARIQPEIRQALLQEVTATAREEAARTAVAGLRATEAGAERIAAAYAKALQAQRAEDRREIETTLARIQSQRVADLAALKRQLDTLALNTDAGLRHTAEGLVELANLRVTPTAAETPRTSTQ